MQGEESTAQVEGNLSDEGLESRLLREVIRTPAFREIIRVNSDGIDADGARQVIGTLIREDPEIPMGLVSASPRVIDAAVESVVELGRHLRGMPQPLLEEYIAQIVAEIDGGNLRELPQVWGPTLVRALPLLISTVAQGAASLATSLGDGIDDAERADLAGRIIGGVDGAELGRALNALSLLAMRTAPALLEELEGSGQGEAFVLAADFGKLRVALNRLSSCGKAAARNLMEPALSDPVVVANLLVTLPPLVNDHLELFGTVLEELKLGDELLASAVFNSLDAIDAQQVGRIVTDLSRTLNALHRGSMILGLTEPAFKATATRFVDGLLETVDGEALGKAIVALGEDGETILEVWGDMVRRDPDLLPRLVETGLAAHAPLLRGAAGLLHEANQLPDAVFLSVAERLRAGLDVEEASRLLNELFRLARRLQTADPETDAMLPELLAALDTTTARDLGRDGLRALADALLAHPEIESALEPEALGQQVNEALKRFNSYMESRPDQEGNFLLRFASAIEPSELEKAWRTVIGTFTGTLLSSADRARAVVRPIVSVGLQSMALMAGLRRRRRDKAADKRAR